MGYVWVLGYHHYYYLLISRHVMSADSSRCSWHPSVTAAMVEVSALSSGALMRRGPYISMITNRTMNLLLRAAMLFMVGVFLALVLNLLQVQRNVTLFPPDVLSSVFSSAWWVPPCCGTAAGTQTHAQRVISKDTLYELLPSEESHTNKCCCHSQTMMSLRHCMRHLIECHSSFFSVDRFAVPLYGSSSGGAT